MFLGTDTLEDHSQLSKKANESSVQMVASFSYEWWRRHAHAIPGYIESLPILCFSGNFATVRGDVYLHACATRYMCAMDFAC